MEKKKSRVYTEEFRRQAVALSEELGSVMKAAHQLGVSEANIYSWRKVGQSLSFASTKVSAEEELRRLRKENSDLKKINHVLKAAAAFFSQDHLK